MEKNNIYFSYSWKNPKGLWYNICFVPKAIKYFIQRGIRGYSDQDVWNLDMHLARVMHGSITKLQANKNGCPWDIPSDEYGKALKDILIGLEAYREIQDDTFLEDCMEANDNKEDLLCPAKLEVEKYKEEVAKRMEKFNKAMDLLKQYYCYLWD
jgi:hypothetical protein